MLLLGVNICHRLASTRYRHAAAQTFQSIVSAKLEIFLIPSFETLAALSILLLERHLP
jgi:hypothetical protein